MQSFTPFPTPSLCAATLDNTRLNSNINELLIALRTLSGWYIVHDKKGWPHHPNVLMWRGYEYALANYAYRCLFERALRKCAPDMTASCHGKHFETARVWRFYDALAYVDNFTLEEAQVKLHQHDFPLPPFLNGEPHPRHTEQRLRLYRKDPDFYGQRFSELRNYIPFNEWEDLGISNDLPEYKAWYEAVYYPSL